MRLNALENTLEGIVLPNDIDVNGHVNNGRFMTVCDLNRIDFFIRTGLARIMLQRKWMPIISYHDMNYYKSLKFGKRYRCGMSMERWDEKYFYMRHWFTNASGATVAEGVSRAVIRGRDGVISPEEVVAAVAAYQGVSMVKPSPE
ncbi:acyl-CoA thioesterase [Salinicola sp. JS01]|uniref:acyl-CoA thioesterase n=1 Tax=Salinicola sp. JS01 TaxID=3050071 RepID=UPI00255BE444|nr:acyl-CoA thioesterase [Salinicola sp. JS01]WIX32154.1 acyl-CoA thioesterase [Salinicola sp. JS01]